MNEEEGRANALKIEVDSLKSSKAEVLHLFCKGRDAWNAKKSNRSGFKFCIKIFFFKYVLENCGSIMSHLL